MAKPRNAYEWDLAQQGSANLVIDVNGSQQLRKSETGIKRFLSLHGYNSTEAQQFIMDILDGKRPELTSRTTGDEFEGFIG